MQNVSVIDLTTGATGQPGSLENWTARATGTASKLYAIGTAVAPICVYVRR